MAIGAAIATGVGSLLGTVLQNQASKKEARKNREFQERMSSTAHQREVADLRAAGLNPILSAMGGSGASTPGGAMANIESMTKDATNSALSALKAKEELNLIRKTAQNQHNQGEKARHEGITSMHLRNYYDAQNENTQAQTRVINDQQTGTSLDARINRSMLGLPLRAVERTLGGANSAASLIKAYGALKKR